MTGRSNLPVIVNSSGKLGTSSVAELLARSGMVKRLRTKVSSLRAKLRVRTKRLRQRDRRLADRIRQLGEQVGDIAGG